MFHAALQCYGKNSTACRWAWLGAWQFCGAFPLRVEQGSAGGLCEGSIEGCFPRSYWLWAIVREELVPSVVAVEGSQSEECLIASQAPELSGELESSLVLTARRFDSP